jgi:uncharacterized protein
MAGPISRRTLITGAGAFAGVCVLDGIFVEPNWLDVTFHEVPVRGLPRALDGFSIAQVTDAHLTSLGRTELAIASAIQSLDVQVVTLTGDMLDSVAHIPTLKAFCSALRKAGTTIFATLGNWEHWAAVPLDVLRANYRDVGVTLLVNGSTVLPDGVQVAATDDYTAGTVHLRSVEDVRGDARILLTHSPAILDEDIMANVTPFSLALAGHTHGGQVRVTALVAPVRPVGSGRFTSGWYDTAVGRSYVSRGTGTSVLPVRFTCRPELPIFRLRQG